MYFERSADWTLLDCGTPEEVRPKLPATGRTAATGAEGFWAAVCAAGKDVTAELAACGSVAG
jgi:hypothetical protein